MSAAPGPHRRFFDAWSLFYDLPAVQRLTYRPVHDAVLRALRASAPRRVLDVGCGTGLLTARIRRGLPDVRVVGCDFSAGMLRHAAARTREVAWARGDAQRLPLRDASFDAVVSTEAFHWFPDQGRALAEFHRVLAPGGRVYLALINTPFTAASELLRVGSRLVGEPFYWPTREQMRRMLENAGFGIESQHRVLRIVPTGLMLPPVLTTAVKGARS
jgi:ubiquinone/menaquinone biosynthesis C-methylase UbiE